MAVFRTIVIIVVLTLGWIAMRTETLARETSRAPIAASVLGVRPLSQGAP